MYTALEHTKNTIIYTVNNKTDYAPKICPKICHQKPLKVGVNRQFQAKMPKLYENRLVSKTVNPIKPNFVDIAETTIFTSWVDYYYPKPNPTWLTAAILKIAMTS